MPYSGRLLKSKTSFQEKHTYFLLVSFGRLLFIDGNEAL